MDLHKYRPSPLKNVLWLLFVSVLAVVGLAFVVKASMMMLFQLTPQDFDLLQDFSREGDRDRKVLLFFSGFHSMGVFIITPILFIRYFLKEDFTQMLHFPKQANHLGLILLIVLSFMVVNGLFIEWNKNLDLPDSALEDYLRGTEANMEQLTRFLISVEGPLELAYAFLVVVVITSIGEELFFRGLLQTLLIRLYSNPHIGIGVCSLLFSIIHFQFYGLVPRILLGVLFGYLFFWSGSLWIPILCHAFNNSIMLFGIYLHTRGHIQYDLEDSANLPPLWVATVALCLFVYLLRIYRQRCAIFGQAGGQGDWRVYLPGWSHRKKAAPRV